MPSSKRSRATIVSTRKADENHAVVRVEGGGGAFCRTPCPECPWRRENVGNFPAEAFRLSANTARDLADVTFSCHMAGSGQPMDCAGGLLSTGAEHNLRVRIRILNETFRYEWVDAAGADLFPSYRAMAEANGVDPDDPALEGCL